MKRLKTEKISRLKYAMRSRISDHTHTSLPFTGTNTPPFKILVSDPDTEKDTIKAISLKGMFKMILGILYFISLVYFLAVLIT
jgi:hypothetical protein